VLDDRPAHATGPASQAWTRQAGDALREAAAAVRAARAGNRASLDPALLAGLRHSYYQAVAFGISVNLSRSWHKGNHPGLILARRLKRKVGRVWLFATRFDVPATNNGSENAVRATSSPRKSAAAGAPWRPCSATAASAPTSPPSAATAATPSQPSATHSTEPAGCRPPSMIN
jgi:hypothetical protein